MPATHEQASIGTLNLCGDAGQYGEADIPSGKLLAALLVPVVMAADAR